MKPILYAVIAAVLLFFAGCVSLPNEPERDAPLDTANPDYVAPAVVFTAGPVGDTLDVDQALFEWSGNTYCTEYSTRLNDAVWSEWDSIAFVLLDSLPEGYNVFRVRGRYVNGDVSPACDSAVFWVDALPPYVPPSVVISAGPVGDTVLADRTVFEWEGNDASVEYSWRLNGSGWTSWTTSEFAGLDLLAEGMNVFEVRSRYVDGDVSPQPDSAVFWVDAVLGPALLVGPRAVDAVPGDVIELSLYADEVTDLAMAYTRLTYDPALLLLQSVSAGPFLAADGGQAVVFTKASGDTLAVTVMRSALGHEHGVSGCGVVCTLRFSALGAGSAPVVLLQDASGLRTPAGELPLRAVGRSVVTCR